MGELREWVDLSHQSVGVYLNGGKRRDKGTNWMEKTDDTWIPS